VVRTRDIRPILPDDDLRVALRLKAGRRRELVIDQSRRLSRLRGLLCSIQSGCRFARSFSRARLIFLIKYFIHIP
jgi:hypothetical protein